MECATGQGCGRPNVDGALLLALSRRTPPGILVHLKTSDFGIASCCCNSAFDAPSITGADRPGAANKD